MTTMRTIGPESSKPLCYWLASLERRLPEPVRKPDMRRATFRGISTRTKQLLAHEEGLDVGFKESTNGVTREVLLAFANSPQGGTILMGVKETTTQDGRRKTQLIGCPVGDRFKRQILDRAEQCLPPVDVEIFVENRGHKPFYRVEVPSGRTQPYCTPGGTYKIRGDGRTNPPSPDRLLALFVDPDFVRRRTSWRSNCKRLT